MTDFASSYHREYDSWRGQILRKTHQDQISRSKSEWMIFLQYTTNSTYFVYTERRKKDHCDELRLLFNFCKNRLRTHRVMALAYLPLNGDFVVFLRLTTNSAYLNTYQRREKVEQRILKISWKFHENSRVFDGVMTLALLCFETQVFQPKSRYHSCTL